MTAPATSATISRPSQRLAGLSDRTVAWLFVGPTMLLLLAINIFPLIWTVKLSFTNFRANRPNAEVLSVGLDNYISVLTDPDIWAAMQTTAHFGVRPVGAEIGERKFDRPDQRKNVDGQQQQHRRAHKQPRHGAV